MIRKLSEIILFIMILLLISTYTIYATHTCVNFPIEGNIDSLLSKNNLYHYVQNRIIMKASDNDPRCNKNEKNITFCYITDLQNRYSCTPITLNLNESRNLNEIDINLKPNSILLKAEIYQDQYLCLMSDTTYGMIPIGCKEYPYINDEIENNHPKIISESDKDLSKISDVCYKNNYSKFTIGRFKIGKLDLGKLNVGVSGMLVHCIRDSFSKTLYNESDNSFKNFKNNMKFYVIFFMILGVYFIGSKFLFNTITNYELIIFILKFIFVSVLCLNNTTSNIWNVNNLFIDIPLELLDNLSIGIISLFRDSQSCDFSTADYPPGYGFYALWDYLDCKTIHIYEIKDTVSGFWSKLIMYMAIGIITIFYIFLLLISLSIYLYLNIQIYLLAYLSILFIPTILLESTEQYFNNWIQSFITSIQGGVILLLTTLLLIYITDGSGYINDTNIMDDGKVILIFIQNIFLFILLYYNQEVLFKFMGKITNNNIFSLLSNTLTVSNITNTVSNITKFKQKYNFHFKIQKQPNTQKRKQPNTQKQKQPNTNNTKNKK